MQAYSNPKRASNSYALPDAEVWRQISTCETNPTECDGECGNGCQASGWYWWSCFPGCLPDGDPSGPFATEADALADAQEEAES